MEITKRILVLIVDDDLATCETLCDIFELNNFEVVIAHNGKDAFDCLQEKSFEVAMLDIRLPDIDGLELFKKMKTVDVNLTGIFMTGHASFDYAKRALDQGASGFFVKPLFFTEILHVINEALEKRSLADQVKKRNHELLLMNEQLEEEVARRQVQEALILRAKQEWERTIDAMPDMIAIIDTEHRIVRVNKTMLNKLGTTYDEFVGSKCNICVHDDNRPPEYCPHNRLLSDGREHREEIYEEKLGGHCEIIVVPYRDPDGTLIGSVHIVRDINEQKQEEQEKEKLLTQLLHAQKLESVGQLASGIAHEINTPTQFIGTNIDFLDDAFADIANMVTSIQKEIQGIEGNQFDRINGIIEEADWEYLAEEFPDAVRQSKEGVSRVSSIVMAMKEFSHPGSRTKGPADLNHLIETTITVARNEWKYVADIEVDLDQDLPQVPCLVDEMGQVVLNILVNSSHAIESKLGKNPEGKKGIISIRTQLVDSYVELRIRDNGAGIPKDVQLRIFDPFFTTKMVGKGTGQGLAIARDVIVEKHQGTIEVESVTGEGATLIIKLPLEDGEDHE